MDKIAEKLSQWDLTDPPIDVDRICLELGIPIQVTTLDDGTYGVLVKKLGKAVIGLNQIEDRFTHRFIIAHLLGHLFIHSDKNSEFFVETGFTFADCFHQRESEANQFAMQLLIPDEALRNALTRRNFDLFNNRHVEWLARRFQVSAVLLSVRLARLEGFYI